MRPDFDRVVPLCAAVLLAFSGAAHAGDKTVRLTTSAIDFSPTFVCSAVNVGSAPVAVTIELLSPQSGEALANSTTVTTTLDPGFGASNEFSLSVGFTAGYCRVSYVGEQGTVRAAACSKPAQNAGCQGVSEAR